MGIKQNQTKKDHQIIQSYITYIAIAGTLHFSTWNTHPESHIYVHGNFGHNNNNYYTWKVGLLLLIMSLLRELDLTEASLSRIGSGKNEDFTESPPNKDIIARDEDLNFDIVICEFH